MPGLRTSVTYEVVFHPVAADDLKAIDLFVSQDQPASALALIRGIRAHCETLSAFPRRGRRRMKLEGEVRTISFERRVLIAYRVEPETVTILRVFYAGQNFTEMFEGFED